MATITRENCVFVGIVLSGVSLYREGRRAGERGEHSPRVDGT